jgi:hypothetical protein
MENKKLPQRLVRNAGCFTSVTVYPGWVGMRRPRRATPVDRMSLLIVKTRSAHGGSRSEALDSIRELPCEP